MVLIKSLVLTAPFLNNRWDPQRRQREQDPLLAAETCTILTLRRKLWLRWRADPQEDPLRHCHKELLVLSLNQHLNGTIWMLFIWWEKALEWKHSQTNSHLILFPVTFSNYKGGNGRPTIMATFSLGSCGSSSFHPLHQLVSVIMLPTTSFKPGSGQKKAEGSLHLICLPVKLVISSQISLKQRNRSFVSCWRRNRCSTSSTFTKYESGDWVLSKIGMVGGAKQEFVISCGVERNISKQAWRNFYHFSGFRLKMLLNYLMARHSWVARCDSCHEMQLLKFHLFPFIYASGYNQTIHLITRKLC